LSYQFCRESNVELRDSVNQMTYSLEILWVYILVYFL